MNENKKLYLDPDRHDRGADMRIMPRKEGSPADGF